MINQLEITDTFSVDEKKAKVEELSRTRGFGRKGVLHTLAMVLVPGYVFKELGEQELIDDLKEQVGLQPERSGLARIEDSVVRHTMAFVYTGTQLAAYFSTPYIAGLISEVLNK
ncbi:MAG: hypothetical protein KAT77_04760 [Nanoarchaeota archaeon]|nr:hypothetical protein [Nanoarchaeota archaeon]